jgi:hypothetical protein
MLGRTAHPHCYRDGKRRKWSEANCVRAILNDAGIDFSLPNDAPVEGTKVEWVLLKGGVGISHATSAITWPIVEFVGDPDAPRIQTAVGVNAPDFMAPETDRNGRATIDIQGTYQKVPLYGKLVPIMKQAVVAFSLAPKPIRFRGDIIDAIGTGFLSGTVGTAVLAPVEMLLRSLRVYSGANSELGEVTLNNVARNVIAVDQSRTPMKQSHAVRLIQESRRCYALSALSAKILVEPMIKVASER